MDRYVVLEYLAEGGMGAIYVGKRLGAGGFEKQVVLKQLLPEFTQKPEFIDLFLREARLSATLDHANIIHTIDLVTAGEDYFIVMEYLDGADLRALLKRCKLNRSSLSPGSCLHIIREILTALAYAHTKLDPKGDPLDLIHRDISPSNILVSGSGEVKLTDFGIAKASTHSSVFYRVKGKVGYMSPEQARSEDIDARSDLYSLAVCLYEALTSEKLFVHKGITTSVEEMYSQPIPLVSRKVSGLPADLDKLMLKALAIDPDARFQTAGEFQEALLRCAYKHGLMISAVELSTQLESSCGPRRSWRDEEDSGVPPLVEGGTEQIDMGEFVDSDGEIDVGLPNPDFARKEKEDRTAANKLNELQGLELTSMINLAAVEDRDSVEDVPGASPLVELDVPPASDFEEPPQTVVGTPGRDVPPPATSFSDTPPAEIADRLDVEGSHLPRILLTLAGILVLGIVTALVIGFSGPTIDLPSPQNADSVAPE